MDKKLRYIIKTSADQSRSQLNHSPAKALPFFSTSPRFKSPQTNPFKPVFYNPSTPQNGLFGKEKRELFNLNLDNPSPDSYNLSSLNKNSKCWTMGISREDSKPFGIYSKQKEAIPGPNYILPDSKSVVAFSILGRHQQKQPFQTPGPGEYHLQETINHKGRLNESKYRNVPQIVIKKNLFNKIPKDSPGPGKYNAPEGTSENGKYFISKFVDSRSRKFEQATLKSYFDAKYSLNYNESIGPGSYNLHSEFGEYDKMKTIKSNLVSQGRSRSNSKGNEKKEYNSQRN